MQQHAVRTAWRGLTVRPLWVGVLDHSKPNSEWVIALVRWTTCRTLLQSVAWNDFFNTWLLLYLFFFISSSTLLTTTFIIRYFGGHKAEYLAKNCHIMELTLAQTKILNNFLMIWNWPLVVADHTSILGSLFWNFAFKFLCTTSWWWILN